MAATHAQWRGGNYGGGAQWWEGVKRRSVWWEGVQRRSVVEEAQARERHGHPVVVGGGDHLLVGHVTLTLTLAPNPNLNPNPNPNPNHLLVGHAAARGDDVLDAARRGDVDRVLG